MKFGHVMAITGLVLGMSAPLGGGESLAQERTGMELGLQISLPFNGRVKDVENSAWPRLKLGLGARISPGNWQSQTLHQSAKLGMASVDFSGFQVNRVNVMGHSLRFDGDQLYATKSDETSMKEVGVALAGLAAAGVVGILLFNGQREERPDACIAIYPPPPHCQ